MKLVEFILCLAEEALARPDAYLCAGHNGPYHDLESPVRNSGHWLITFARCYDWTGNDRYRRKVEQLAQYLCSREVRPGGFAFLHRWKKGKDKANGLIGQAWTFEALAEASRILKTDAFDQLAEDVFFQHPFDKTLGLWNRLDVDGHILAFDPTFNHQLWFAACASLLRGKRKHSVKKRVVRFLDCVEKNITVRNHGLIYHPIEHLLKTDQQSKNMRPASIKKKFLRFMGVITRWQSHENMKNPLKGETKVQEQLMLRSIGYHSFNMYAFALIRKNAVKHPFWASDKCGGMIDYLLTDGYNRDLEDNPYGYPYNPVGFEVPYALSVLKPMIPSELVRICTHWVNEQLKRSYNKGTKMMDRNTEDPATHSARIYEAGRLEDWLLRSIRVT